MSWATPSFAGARAGRWASDRFGPGGPQEPAGNYTPAPVAYDRFARMPAPIASLDDYKQWIDGYDCGVAYADLWCGRILNALADKGVLDDTLVLITSDHGETR